MVDTGTGGDRELDRRIAEMLTRRSHPPKAEVPAPLKWAAGITSGVLAALAVSGLIWVAATLQSTSDVVIRMDERMSRFLNDVDRLDRRVSDLEDYHKEARGP